MSLFNLEKEFFDICNELEENGGELTPDLEARLSISSDNVDTYMHKYHRYIKFNKSSLEYLKDCKDQLTSRIKATENATVRIKEAALKGLITFGTTGKTGNLTIKYDDLTVFSRSTAAVEINDEATKDLVIALDPDTGLMLDAYTDLEIDSEINTIATTQITLKLAPFQAKHLMKYINEALNDLDITDCDKSYSIIWNKDVIKEIGTPTTAGVKVVTNTNIQFR